MILIIGYHIWNIFFEWDILIEIRGAVHVALGKKEIDNFTYIKDNEENLYYGSLVRIWDDEAMEYGKRVRRAGKYAPEGVNVLFVLPPSKMLYGVSQMNREWPVNDPNAIQDEVLLRMQQNKVPTLDLRNTFIKSDLKIEEMFYKTDNYWTTEAAFLAATEIVERIKEVYDDDWDPNGYYCDRNQYESVIYEQVSVGSLGKRTGIVYGGKDDITIMWPKFETKMEWYNIYEEEKIRGNFKEALISWESEWLEEKYRNHGIRMYLSGTVDHGRITNELNSEGPKLLCLGDDYFSPVVCFLAPMCSQIDLVYARREENDINYELLIQEEGYDYLIIENNPFHLYDDAFDYFKN